MTKPLHPKDCATIKEVVLHMQQHTPGLTLQEYVTGCVLRYTQAVIKELGIGIWDDSKGGQQARQDLFNRVGKIGENLNAIEEGKEQEGH